MSILPFSAFLRPETIPIDPRGIRCMSSGRANFSNQLGPGAGHALPRTKSVALSRERHLHMFIGFYWIFSCEIGYWNVLNQNPHALANLPASNLKLPRCRVFLRLLWHQIRTGWSHEQWGCLHGSRAKKHLDIIRHLVMGTSPQSVKQPPCSICFRRGMHRCIRHFRSFIKLICHIQPGYLLQTTTQSVWNALIWAEAWFRFCSKTWDWLVGLA